MIRTLTPVVTCAVLLLCGADPLRAQGTAFTTLTNGSVSAQFNSWGTIGEDAAAGSPAFEVPAGSGNHPLYSSALWVTGRAGGVLHASAAMYGPMLDGDYWTGPLTTDGTASILPGTATAYDQIWCVDRAEVDLHLNYFACLADPNCDAAVLLPNYQVPASFLDWPAIGDVSLDLDLYQAPFYDHNGDGDYQPADGDAPCFLGDRACFMVMNDQRPHSLTAAPPLGIEVKVMPFVMLNAAPPIANTVFVRMHLINRSSQTYTDTRIGMHADFDLGNYADDLIGTDVTRNLLYVYNGDNMDDASLSGPGYGAQPPAFGLVMLKGPLMEPNGVDDPVVNALPSFNGMAFGDGVIDNERLGLSWSRYFNNVTGPMGDPVAIDDFEHYLDGDWLDGIPQSYGGTGYSTSPSSIPARFIYPGASDPFGVGTGGVPQAPWTEMSAGNAPGDRRMIGTMGPITLEPGEHVDLVFAYVYARASSGGPAASIAELQVAADSAHALFYSGLPGLPDPFTTGDETAWMACNAPNITLGAGELGALLDLDLFPVPATDRVQVRVPAGLSGELLVLRDALGRQVLAHRLTAGANTIAIDGLAKGLYTAEVITTGSRYVGRVVKE